MNPHRYSNEVPIVSVFSLLFLRVRVGRAIHSLDLPTHTLSFFTSVFSSFSKTSYSVLAGQVNDSYPSEMGIFCV
jgi:hypothetical protein